MNRNLKQKHYAKDQDTMQIYACDASSITINGMSLPRFQNEKLGFLLVLGKYYKL
jgi:hypothetical protein